jgi:hypothetical protein
VLTLALIAAAAAQSTWDTPPDMSVNRGDRSEREYIWSAGLVTRVVVPMMGSGAAWDPSPSIGGLFEFSTGAPNVSLYLGFDWARHHLIRGDRYVPDMAEGAGDALEGTSSHWGISGGLRWMPGVGPSPLLPVRPYFSANLGVDLASSSLDLPGIEGRVRTGSFGVRPTIGPGFGVLVKVHEHLHVALDTRLPFVLAFNSSEVQGADTMEPTARLGTGLQLLGRF